jgi:hypothetical protein
MKTLLAAAVATVLLASGTLPAFADSTVTSAPKIEQKAATAPDTSKSALTTAKADTKGKVEDKKGKIVEHAKVDHKKADAVAKVDAKAKTEPNGQK